ncbi:Gfo/Idh/MocA family protein [Halosegnis marinus]|uniref:Gfo/Idh/MocA family oxidoreductase n=1 Tax=Halosegnis marinus TaxID=3034023 RepID=A0ABD5ZRT1_9EURY|nr:Gfo/Idh/MocA family oxidoreductase [Halosegnis sp. DT85]
MHEAFTDIGERDWDTGADGTVRLAVVGCGGFARGVVLPSIGDCDYVEATVGVSGSAENREKVADGHGLETTDYDGYAAGDLADAYDAVYVATPNRLHLPHVETAAEQGKAVVCEKPLEATPERAEEVVAVCEDAGVPLMTAYRMQADPLFRALKAFLDAGGVGAVEKFAGDFTFPVLMGSRGPDQWRLDAHLAGGGALMDVGVYPLNAARYLLGAEPEAVSGRTRTGGPYADVDEHVSFRVAFPDATGNFTASFSGHPNADFAVYGSEGVVRLFDAFQPNRGRRLVVETGDGSYEITGAGGGELREEFDYFAHAVLTGSDIGPDGADGLADVWLMDAIYADAE